MLDTTKPLISSTELSIYDEEIKNYIKEQGGGLTAEEIQNMINASDNGIKVSTDNTYEPLDVE